MDHSSISKSVHTRLFFIVAAVTAAICTIVAYTLAPVAQTVASAGFVKGWGASISLPPEVNAAIAVAVNGAIAALMLHVNKVYNLLRTLTKLHAAMFVVLQVSLPMLLVCCVPGSLLCLLLLWCVALMYMCYGVAPVDTPKVFMVFCLLSAWSSIDYCALVYVPVFILGCLQLRIFSLRCLSAIVLGLVTPWVILMGFGIVTADMVQMPLSGFSLSDLLVVRSGFAAGVVAFTAFAALAAFVQNVVKIIAYNARSRSMLSLVTTMTLVTIAAALVDQNHPYAYATTLNCLAAFQFAHLFAAVHNFSKSYIGVFGVMLLYILMYVWSLLSGI